MRGLRSCVLHGTRLNTGWFTPPPLQLDKIRVIKPRLAKRAKVKPATDDRRLFR